MRGFCELFPLWIRILFPTCPTGLKTSDKSEAQRLFAHPGVDVPTLVLCAAMWAGLVGNALWAWREPGPLWAHALAAVFFLNFSFTIWHEAAHGTAFRSRLGNDLVGVLGSFPALIPYFMIRRVHHLHHEFTNDPERDPDYWFLQGSIWSLPLRYLGGVRRTKAFAQSTNPPAREVWMDRATMLAALGLMGFFLWHGRGVVLLAVWLVPKGIAMWIHAWYVNVLPHRGLPAERYRDTRIFPVGWLVPLTLCHNYHGLHHAWQTVPWHRYGRAFRAREQWLAERGTPVHRRLVSS